VWPKPHPHRRGYFFPEPEILQMARDFGVSWTNAAPSTDSRRACGERRMAGAAASGYRTRAIVSKVCSVTGTCASEPR
jgi:hypothetical protein